MADRDEWTKFFERELGKMDTHGMLMDWAREIVGAGEPGIFDINTVRHRPHTSLVVYDEDFAGEQLERMMRAPHAFAPSMNPCAEIPLGDLKPQKLYMAQQDWDDIVKWDSFNPDPAT